MSKKGRGRCRPSRGPFEITLPDVMTLQCSVCDGTTSYFNDVAASMLEALMSDVAIAVECGCGAWRRLCPDGTVEAWDGEAESEMVRGEDGQLVTRFRATG